MARTEETLPALAADAAYGQGRAVVRAGGPTMLGEARQENTTHTATVSVTRFWSPGGQRGTSIQRYKGLGQMNPEQLRQTVFGLNGHNETNPSLNENMVRVIADDDAAANAAFDLWAKVSRNRRKRLMGYSDHRDVLDNGAS